MFRDFLNLRSSPDCPAVFQLAGELILGLGCLSMLAALQYIAATDRAAADAAGMAAAIFGGAGLLGLFVANLAARAWMALRKTPEADAPAPASALPSGQKA